MSLKQQKLCHCGLKFVNLTADMECRAARQQGDSERRRVRKSMPLQTPVQVVYWGLFTGWVLCALVARCNLTDRLAHYVQCEVHASQALWCLARHQWMMAR